MNYTYVIHEEKEPYIELTGCLRPERVLRLPGSVQGLPVMAIGSRAFERMAETEEIIIPEPVRTIGSFAFYGCKKLRRLAFTDNLENWSFGAVRFCDEIGELAIRVRRNRLTVLRDLLGDVDYAFRVFLQYDDHTEGFYFPGYTRGFDEDTFARAIHTFTEGSGWAFRETVLRSGVDAREYEKLFLRATYDGTRTGAEIALMRLMYSENLPARARRQYEEFLAQNAGEILPWLAARGERERCMFMLRSALASSEDVSAALPAAVASRDSELVGMMMEYGRGAQSPDDDTFDLDDL